MTKIEKVKRFLESGRAITPRLAVSRFQYWRLSDCILKLRRSGLKIVTEMVRKGKTTYAKYSMK